MPRNEQGDTMKTNNNEAKHTAELLKELQSALDCLEIVMGGGRLMPAQIQNRLDCGHETIKQTLTKEGE
jgi:hypothetical protein